MMKNLLTIIIMFFFSLSSFSYAQADNQNTSESVKLLVVTGGPTLRHHIDLVPTSFYGLFNEQPNLVWDHATYDEAAFQSEKLNDYDVVLMYNRSDSLSKTSQQNFKEYLESGKGLIVLHHSLGSYNIWEWWWKEVVGGKYQMKESDNFPKSDYKLGEKIKIISQINHPITKKIGNFSLTDETYKKLWISKKVKVLYKTDNPTSDGPIMWISPYKKSRVIVIQPGHAASAHTNDNYKKLIYQSILWVSNNKNRAK